MSRLAFVSSFFLCSLIVSGCNSTETGNPLQPNLPDNEIGQDEMPVVTPPNDNVDQDGSPQPQPGQVGPDPIEPGDTDGTPILEPFIFRFADPSISDGGAVGGAQPGTEPSFSFSFLLNSISLTSCGPDSTTEELALSALGAEEEAELAASDRRICEVRLKSADSAEVKNQQSLSIKNVAQSLIWRFRFETPWSIRDNPGLTLSPSGFFTEQEFEELANPTETSATAAEYISDASLLANIWTLAVPSEKEALISEGFTKTPLQELCDSACPDEINVECKNQEECRLCQESEECNTEQRALLLCQASLPEEISACSEASATTACERFQSELNDCEDL